MESIMAETAGRRKPWDEHERETDSRNRCILRAKAIVVTLAQRFPWCLFVAAWLGGAAAYPQTEISVVAEPPRLTWSDFQTVESLAGSEDAHIGAEISFPRPLRMESVAGAYRLPAFTITVAPEPSRSLVRRSAKGSAELLRHEQGHYDLVLLAARALARELATLTTSSATELSQRTQDCVSEHTERAARLSQAYDRQTDHGRNTPAQARWSDRIGVARAAEAVDELDGMPL
jgi:uncharacterized protein DUF922